MLITVATLTILWAALAIGLRLFPLPKGGRKWLSIIVLSASVFIAVIFELTPRGTSIEPYCATMAHYQWPLVALFIYPLLLIAACLLLQHYHRIAGGIYLFLIALPLAISPAWVKMHCSGEQEMLLADSIQGVVMLTAFPIISIVLGSALLLYLGISAWSNRQQIWPGLALFSLFLLFQHHAIRDWFRFIFEV